MHVELLKSESHTQQIKLQCMLLHTQCEMEIERDR